MDNTKFDVEKTMNQFVIEFGGNLVTNLVEGPIEKPNADYVFPKHNVIAELKCFQKDLFSEEDDAERLNLIMDKWRERGWFDDEEKMMFIAETRSYHPDMIKDFIKIARRTIERTIHHGSKQIWETKKLLNMPTARGFLLLCNDGNYFLPPFQFMRTIVDIMLQKYQKSHINAFVFFTVNQLAYLPGEEGALMWYPFFKEDRNKDKKLGEFSEELRLSFLNSFMPELTGGPKNLVIPSAKPFDQEDMDHIVKLKYIPKNR